jgi:nucleolar protein 12
LTDEQKIERDQRTIFVGNLPVDASLKKVKKFFKTEVGRVEHIRFRSICTVQDSKKSERAKIITKEFNTDQKDNKNAYICFEKEAHVEEAVTKLNGTVFLEKTLRVDRLMKGLDEDGNPKLA